MRVDRSPGLLTKHEWYRNPADVELSCKYVPAWLKVEPRARNELGKSLPRSVTVFKCPAPAKVAP